MSYMVDIFNRLGGGRSATPPPAPSASQGAFSGLMGNFAPPAPQSPNPQGAFSGLMGNFAPQPPAAPQPPNPQGAFSGLMQNFSSPAPQAPPLGPLESFSGPITKEEQFLVQWGIPPQVAQNMAGGNDRVGYRAANGDTGLQGANMPPQGGGVMFGGGAPQPMSPMLPMSPAMFDSSGPMPNWQTPQQMPNWQTPQQMPAFQAPPPMPLMPQQPMPGMQPYNFSQQMGQTAPPSPMNGQMKGMFGVR